MYLDEDKVDEAGERISEVFTGLSKARGGPGCEGQLDAVARYATEAPVSVGIATARTEGIVNVCKFVGGDGERSGRSAGIAIPAPLSEHDGSPWEEGGNRGEAP